MNSWYSLVYLQHSIIISVIVDPSGQNAIENNMKTPKEKMSTGAKLMNISRPNFNTTILIIRTKFYVR